MKIELHEIPIRDVVKTMLIMPKTVLSDMTEN